MSTEHSDPPRRPTDKDSEVLSDATDLDALLEAILGDQVAAVATPSHDEVSSPAAVAVGRSEPSVVVPPHVEVSFPAEVAVGRSEPSVVVPPHDEVSFPAEVAVERSEPSVVAPPHEEVTFPSEVAVEHSAPSVDPTPTEVDPEHAFARGATADENDAWGFVSEDSQAGNETAGESSTVTQNAPAAAVPSLSQRTWRDAVRVSRSKQLLLVAALSAMAIIAASSIRLGGEPTATDTLPSSGVPALVPPPSSPVQVPSAVTATNSPEVEVWAAARAPVEQPVAISRTPPRRSNEVTGDRTNVPTKAALSEAPRSAPSSAPSSAPIAPPVVTSPAVEARIAEPTDREAATSRPLPPEGEQRSLVNSEPTVAANGASVVNGAGPAPAAAAPVSAGAVPRRSAARLLTGPAPEYPVALRSARIGGTVELLLTIDSSGRVTNVQSLTGHAQLRAAAEAAVKRWRYEAARLDNLAVETQTAVRFNFDPSTATARPKE